jgi:hypothetical protein
MARWAAGDGVCGTAGTAGHDLENNCLEGMRCLKGKKQADTGRNPHTRAGTHAFPRHIRMTTAG